MPKGYMHNNKYISSDMVIDYLIDVLGYAQSEAEAEVQDGVKEAFARLSEEQREECIGYNA